MNLRELDKVRPLLRDALATTCGPVTVRVHIGKYHLWIDLLRDGVSSHCLTIRTDDRTIFSSGAIGYMLDEEALCFLLLRAVEKLQERPS
jgi:hypothetical protein